MIALLSRVRTVMRERANRRSVDVCGPNTLLPGVVDRRAPQAHLRIGDGCLIQGQLVVERPESRIEIGNNVLVGADTVVDCAGSISIEDDVLISYKCIIADSDNHSIYSELRANDLKTWMNGRQHDWSHTEIRPVRICKGAWIGARSIILKGVTIGAGAVVGMGSVVAKDVPARMVVAGNPAKPVRCIETLDSSALQEQTGESN